MMQYYATIAELINSINEADISYRNLHKNILIQNNNSIISVPYSSVIRNYLSFFEETEVYARFSPEEIHQYKFKPKKLSLDLYGTTELWSALLEINGMYSTLDFNLEKTIKVFSPNDFLPLLNEVMILENIVV